MRRLIFCDTESELNSASLEYTSAKFVRYFRRYEKTQPIPCAKFQVCRSFFIKSSGHPTHSSGEKINNRKRDFSRNRIRQVQVGVKAQEMKTRNLL